MSFLTINGISVSVKREGPTKVRETVGAGVTRAQDASLRSNWNAKKWRFKGKTNTIANDASLFLRALLDGMGDRFGFEVDLFSDKGVGPSSNSGGTRITASPAPKIGTGALQIAAGGFVAWPIDTPGAAGNGWTLIFWESTAAGTWNRFIYTWSYSGAATTYQNGAVGSLPASLSISLISATALDISNGSAGNMAFDDVLFIPAYCPASFVAGLDAFMTTLQGWATPYPGISVGALATADDMHPLALVCMGQAGEASYVEGALSGSFADNLVELSFELLEV